MKIKKSFINPISLLKFNCFNKDCNKIACAISKRKFYCEDHFNELKYKEKIKRRNLFLKKRWKKQKHK